MLVMVRIVLLKFQSFGSAGLKKDELKRACSTFLKPIKLRHFQNIKLLFYYNS